MISWRFSIVGLNISRDFFSRSSTNLSHFNSLSHVINFAGVLWAENSWENVWWLEVRHIPLLISHRVDSRLRVNTWWELRFIDSQEYTQRLLKFNFTALLQRSSALSSSFLSSDLTFHREIFIVICFFLRKGQIVSFIFSRISDRSDSSTQDTRILILCLFNFAFSILFILWALASSFCFIWIHRRHSVLLVCLGDLLQDLQSFCGGFIIFSWLDERNIICTIHLTFEILFSSRLYVYILNLYNDRLPQVFEQFSYCNYWEIKKRSLSLILRFMSPFS